MYIPQSMLSAEERLHGIFDEVKTQVVLQPTLRRAWNTVTIIKIYFFGLKEIDWRLLLIDRLYFCYFIMDHENNLEFFDFLDFFVENGVQRIPKKYIRDMDNPVEFYRDDEFKNRYRFSKLTVMEVILPLVGDRLNNVNNRRLPFPPLIQIL